MDLASRRSHDRPNPTTARVRRAGAAELPARPAQLSWLSRTGWRPWRSWRVWTGLWPRIRGLPWSAETAVEHTDCAVSDWDRLLDLLRACRDRPGAHRAEPVPQPGAARRPGEDRMDRRHCPARPRHHTCRRGEWACREQHWIAAASSGVRGFD